MRANPKTPPKKDESDNEDVSECTQDEDEVHLECGEFVEEFASTLCQPRYMKQITSQLINSIGMSELDEYVSDLSDQLSHVDDKTEKISRRISNIQSDVSCTWFISIFNFICMLYMWMYLIIRPSL